MTKPPILLLLFWFLSAQQTYALTLETFAKQVLNHQPLFKEALLKLAIKEIELAGSLAKYQDIKWLIEAELGQTNRQLDKNTDYLYAHKTISQKREISTSLSKKFLATGVELNLKYARLLPRKLEDKYKDQGFDDYHYTNENKSYLSLDIVLPLLKNQNGFLSQNTYKRDELDLLSAQLLARDEREDILADYLSQLIDWAYYSQVVLLYKSAINDFAQYSDKADNQANKLDLLNEQNILAQGLLSAKNSRLSIAKNLGFALDNADLINHKIKIDWNKKFQPINRLKTQLKRHNMDIKRIEIEQTINHNQAKQYQHKQQAKLDAIMSVDKTLIAGNYSSYSNSDGLDYKIGLQFSYPFSGDVVAQTNLAKTEVKAEQLQIKYDNKITKTMLDVQKNVDKLNNCQPLVALLKTQISNLIKQLKTQEKCYFTKRKNISKLIDVSHSLLLAKLNKMKSLKDYQQNWLSYENLIGLLLTRYE